MKSTPFRIIDAIHARGLYAPWMYRDLSYDAGPMTADLIKKIDAAECLIADDIARGFFQIDSKEVWSIDDVPSLIAPSPLVWIEFRFPEFILSSEHGVTPFDRSVALAAGVLIHTRDIGDDLTDFFIEQKCDFEYMWSQGVRWFQTMTGILQGGSHNNFTVMWTLPVAAWFVTAEGRKWTPSESRPMLIFPHIPKSFLLAEADRIAGATRGLDTVPEVCCVAALALYHSRSYETRLTTVAPPASASASFELHHGRPLATFRSIDVPSVKQAIKDAQPMPLKVVVCRRSSDSLSPGCVRGYRCRACGRGIQISAEGIELVKSGGFEVCNPCGFRIIELARDKGKLAGFSTTRDPEGFTEALIEKLRELHLKG